MKNYIEISHTYKDSYGDTNIDVWHAVRPTPCDIKFKDGTESLLELGNGHWSILGGKSVEIYDVDDINAIRILLDAIEKEINAEADTERKKNEEVNDND